ncbi:MAG: Anhydro-N-acetylmuramic acid kinase [Synechococcus sp. CC9902]|nr:MAG: Anhydro-N-acetylmuramic acid kinase [Synechococcus sp. CC9902]
MLCLGLMSGTSADGVDAVLARFNGAAQHPRWELLRHRHTPYPQQLRAQLIAAGQGAPLSAADWLELTEATTEMQATAARAADPEQKAALVGCHGQTVWHRTPEAGRRGASWQLLQAPLLAQLLKRPVVHDFRAADLALGGQGAPLVPRADAALLGRVDGWRGLLNLGGIANLTLIPPRCGPDSEAAVLGWDCGPANSLIDLAVDHFTAGAQSIDRDGAMAAGGSCQEQLVSRWLKEHYFHTAPPKSTGREHFGRDDLRRRLEEMQGICSADAVATLTGFTAAVVAQDLDQLFARQGIRPLELLVAGGGSHNPVLVSELRRRCTGCSVGLSDRHGIPVEAREALVFALLAWWHERGHPGNAPAVTGAAREVLLGVRVEPG